MYYYDGHKFKARIIGDDGKYVGKNQVVAIKFNKKTYKVKTDSKGYVTFKIPYTAKPGKYVLTATYKGQTIKKTVKTKIEKPLIIIIISIRIRISFSFWSFWYIFKSICIIFIFSI